MSAFNQIKSIPVLLLSALLAMFTAGCRTPCQDCIPRTQMPYKLSDGGTNYYLTDHISIDQMREDHISENLLERGWIDRLRKKFPNDKDLMAYTDGVETRLKKLGGLGISEECLNDISANLDKSGGELYSYEILGKKKTMSDGTPGVELIDEGELILSKGKVYKKYVTGFDGLESEESLNAEGIK
jgi:hypothetical protein